MITNRSSIWSRVETTTARLNLGLSPSGPTAESPTSNSERSCAPLCCNVGDKRAFAAGGRTNTQRLIQAVEAKVLADVNGTSGIQSQAYATSVLATLRKGITKLEVAGYTASAYVLHPTDWEGVEPYDPATRPGCSASR